VRDSSIVATEEDAKCRFLIGYAGKSVHEHFLVSATRGRIVFVFGPFIDIIRTHTYRLENS